MYKTKRVYPSGSLRGIHALRVISQDTSLSERVRSLNKSPITECLAYFNFIASLEVSSNVSTFPYKFVFYSTNSYVPV